MTTPTDDRPELVTVFATMRALPGKEQELRDALVALVGPTTKEAGCVNYDCHQGIEDPAFFSFYENWESAEHLGAHLGSPHLTAILSRVDDLLEGGAAGLAITQVTRIA